ncbi:MAG: type II toxin-antitoxin system RelE family toxin [Fimbriimonadales bacterium]
MKYSVQILPRAVKQLEKLPVEAYGRVKEVLLSLAEDPRPRGCVKLKGRESWRVRVGHYRVLYEIDDTSRTVTILDVGHRREVYRE